MVLLNLVMCNTGETRYNEVLGTINVFFVISDILLYQYILNNTKQNKLFQWDLRKQFVISGMLLYQISLYRVSTVYVFLFSLKFFKV